MDYTKYAEALRRAGVSEAEILSAVQSAKHEDACLDACRCPQCGRGLSKQVDSRQAGFKFTPHSTWINYRCRQCGYMVDRVEEIT